MNKARHKTKLIMTYLFITMLLSGCVGGGIDINNLALVTAVGVDNGEKPGTVKITVQIVRPADIRGQTGAPSGGTGEPIYSVAAEGKTIFAAIRNLARFTSRRVYWAHNYVIVINEDYARSGIADIIDFFTRNHELRLRSWVVVTPNPASEFVSTITGVEVVPGDAINRLFRYNEIVAEAPKTNMMRLQEAYLSKSTHPILAKVELKKRGISNKKPEKSTIIKQVELSGTAVFKKDKMIGWLSPVESRGLLFFVENVRLGVVPLTCPDSSNQAASVELKRQRFNVTPTYQNGKVEFHVNLNAYADIVESGCTTSLQSMKSVLENELEKQLSSEIQAVVDKAQKKYKVDFLKLGETFNNRYPREWKRIGENWDNEFVNAKITVQVNTHINSSVLLIKSTKSD